jgi:chemotaxis protein CheX
MTDTMELQSISQADIAAAIKAATANVFSTMLGLEVTAGEMLAGKEPARAPVSGVISLIGLTGRWAGTGSMACTAEVACGMSSRFLMAEYKAVDEDVLDAVAEITNMIVGNVKTVLEERVGPLGLSTPTVIFGRNFQTRSARIQEWTRVPFTSSEGGMHIQMCLAPNRDTGSTGLRPSFQFPEVLSI